MTARECMDTLDLERLADGSLDTGRRVAVRTHLDECPTCRERAQEVSENLTAAQRFREALARDDDDPPLRIGMYRVVREIGRGGMGVVYEAEDPALGRRIALKLLRDDGPLVGADAAARFRREAQLLGSLNHPNIATVYSLEEADGRQFLTMELVPGQNLATRARNNPLPVPTALLICREIAKALEVAHAHGVVHRDLKPHNVMAPDHGPVKVLDFGIAKAFGRDLSGDAESSGAAGTPGFMSPEQLRGTNVDHRADIWALGCILYRCLTGRRPFEGATPDLRAQATLDGAVDWTVLPPALPQGVEDLLRSMLQQAPADRPQDATAVARALEGELARPIFMDTGPAGVPRGAGNLPRRVSRFVGREREIRDLRERLAEHRLVTSIGPGGCGKSRLALEAALQMSDDFPGGCWLVELASGTDPEGVGRRVADAMGIKEELHRPIVETLTVRLANQKALIILDNCEHLLGASADVARRILEKAPAVAMLVTSREALGVPGECIVATSPLEVPAQASSLEDVKRTDAARLFATRVRAVRPEFEIDEDNVEAVRQICRRLDGLPLALELAAARARMLSPTEIARHLDDRFRLLSGGSRVSLPRHQTLRASIDWSIGLLAESERKVLERLAIFNGGWTLNAAEAVCSRDGVSTWEVFECFSRLLDKSLVERWDGGDHDGETRYGMLETIRHALLDRLVESGEGPAVRRRHRDYFLALAEEAEPYLTTPKLKDWVVRLTRDYENLKSAIAFSLERGDVDEAMRVAGALGRYWSVAGNWTEAREIFASLLDSNLEGANHLARIKCLNWAGNLALSQGAYDVARDYHDRNLTLSRETGNRWYEASAHNNLGIIARYVGDVETSGTHHETALTIREELGDEWAISLSLFQLGWLRTRQCRFMEALGLIERSLARGRMTGDDSLIGIIHLGMGVALNGEGRRDAGRRALEESLRLFGRIGERWGVALAHHHLAVVELGTGDVAAALHHVTESLERREALDDRQAIAETLGLLGEIVLERNDPERAARFLGAAESIRVKNGFGLTPIESRAIEGVERRAIEALGTARYNELRKEGRMWPMEEVLAHAHEATEVPDA